MLADEVSTWIRAKVAEAGAAGVVVGLSGGIDSAVVAGLACRALGEGVLATILPCHSQPIDEEYALLVARRFDIRVERVDLAVAYDNLMGQLPPASQLATSNVKPRLRMLTNYYLAAKHNYLVAGTGNKTELYIGYFAKYGDGGADILPIGGLLKFQVREVAEDLGVPRQVIERTPTAGLWIGQTDEEEIGLTYAELDRTILGLERGDTTGLRPEAVERVRRMHATSQHKRALPPVFEPGDKPDGRG